MGSPRSHTPGKHLGDFNERSTRTRGARLRGPSDPTRHTSFGSWRGVNVSPRLGCSGFLRAKNLQIKNKNKRWRPQSSPAATVSAAPRQANKAAVLRVLSSLNDDDWVNALLSEAYTEAWSVRASDYLSRKCVLAEPYSSGHSSRHPGITARVGRGRGGGIARVNQGAPLRTILRRHVPGFSAGSMPQNCSRSQCVTLEGQRRRLAPARAPARGRGRDIDSALMSPLEFANVDQVSRPWPLSTRMQASGGPKRGTSSFYSDPQIGDIMIICCHGFVDVPPKIFVTLLHVAGKHSRTTIFYFVIQKCLKLCIFTRKAYFGKPYGLGMH